MEAKRYAMILNNQVYNVSMWDGNLETWQPPQDGTVMVQDDWACPGDWWEESEQRFYRPLPVHTETVEEQHEQDI